MVAAIPSSPATQFPVEASESETRPGLLIVDDDAGPRQSLSIIFRDTYRILTAEDGPQALELIKSNHIHAAVLDIRMSGMSGIDVLNHLKQLDPSIEVIMLTGYETVDTARQALSLGACEYLTKPFDLKEMRDAVAKAMSRHNLSQEISATRERLVELQAEIDNQRFREEVVRARGEIYASIVHDINGPLTIISGFIETICQRIEHSTAIKGEDLSIVKDRLARITRQVNNCIEISRRYLSFLREQSAANSQTRVNQVLRDLEQLVQSHPSLRNHSLEIEPLQTDAEATINGTDLLQVLLNLTVNALQATEKTHRVCVSACHEIHPFHSSSLLNGPESRSLNIENLKPGALLSIVVEDNGPGIPPDLLPRLFTPYVTTKKASEGTGLGLSIVLRLLRQAGAALHVHTKPGLGTTFTILIPLAPS